MLAEGSGETGSTSCHPSSSPRWITSCPPGSALARYVTGVAHVADGAYELVSVLWTLTLDERYFRAIRPLDGEAVSLLPADRGAHDHRRAMCGKCVSKCRTTGIEWQILEPYRRGATVRLQDPEVFVESGTARATFLGIRDARPSPADTFNLR